MIRADLHLHTTASDGTDAPGSIGPLALCENLQCAAITDHDTVSGVPEFFEGCAGYGIDAFCGVEASTGPTGRIHVLCYFDLRDIGVFDAYFTSILDSRAGRAKEIIRKLERMGMTLDADKIFAASSSSVGRPLIAREMVDKGYVGSVAEAIEKYLCDSGPAYVPLPALSTPTAVRELRDMGGVPVLAHPVQMKLSRSALFQTVSGLKNSGLLGLEVYHPDQSGDYREYRELAEDLGLIPTGGSDHHGSNKRDVYLGCTAGAWKNAQKSIDSIKKLLNR